MSGMLHLRERLTKELPKGCQFTLHHLSTPPAPCPPIFPAPPGRQPDETYCESQFLSVSIDREGRQLQVFAIEVLIYMTQNLTTVFVSKADSSGYLNLLGLPKGTPSPFKTIATCFLRCLVTERERPGRKLVLSLFARAQNQYLFPASVENCHKHVLDDRALIKWWCQVVDPILSEVATNDKDRKRDGGLGASAMGYLRVPGYDAYGTKTLFPKDTSESFETADRWRVADPLQELSRSPDLPERCLIPRFPDDPKARFAETLDYELSDAVTNNLQPSDQDGLSSRAPSGKWRSIRSLDQFWEAMAFRQECSSGRLVGFLWAVFTSQILQGRVQVPGLELESGETPTTILPTLVDSRPQEPDRPEILIPTSVESRSIREQPETTEHYHWPVSSQGEIILRPKDYDRIGRLLLRLDYANYEAAVKSTEKWVGEIAERAGVESWGRIVIGENEGSLPAREATNGNSTAKILEARLIKKKRRPAERDATQPLPVNGESAVNTLSTDAVRKRAKTTNDSIEVKVLEPT